MHSETIQTGVAPALGTNPKPAWIISRNEDLTWFIGSAGISYFALLLMASGFPLVPLYFIWLLGVDGPHVLSTMTRTYFDRAERAKLGGWLWAPVPLFFIGPVMVYSGHASLFFLFAVCWQHMHIVKQHFGFVMIYKAKNRERNSKDFFLDTKVLITSLIVPLALFIVRTRPELAGWAFLQWVEWIMIAGFAVLLAAWIWRQAEKFRAGAAMNWPKLALLATVIPLQWLALLHASQHGPDGILRAGIALGLFHSFQYHRLMWFHNQNRYTQPGAAERNGFAARLVSSVFVYLGVAIGLHFTLMFLPTLIFPGHLVASAMWGFSFAHYLFDSRIWHVRSDRELAAALQMA